MTTLPPAQISDIRSTIREVASQACPPMKPSEIVKGCGALDFYHISRLRGIVGLRLKAAGIPTARIAEVFSQPWNTTDNQIKTSTSLAAHPRFAHFFHAQRQQ